MRGKGIAALVMAAALLLTGCGANKGGESAAVQSVAMIVGADLAGTNRYNGVTEAKSTVKVQKDSNKTVKECYVQPGDQVRQGQTLFSYDTDALELTISSAELEVEQLRNTVANYETQIAALQKEKAKAASSDQLSYTLQIQEAELNKSETEYNLKQKEAELAKLKESAGETEVVSSVTGIVQSVQREGEGGGESSDAYITIMETGTYRIKGTAGEESVRSLVEGMEMTAYSRQDKSQRWHGYIDSINTGSAESGDNENSGYYDGAGGETSSKYVFYVTLDNSEGLLIGQHVYLKPGSGEEESAGIQLPAGYLLLDGDIAAVWAESGRGRLERRTVTLGTYDETSDTYQVSAGLSLQDYIAFPDDSLREGMNVTRYDENAFPGTDTFSGESDGADAAAYAEAAAEAAAEGGGEAEVDFSDAMVYTELDPVDSADNGEG